MWWVIRNYSSTSKLNCCRNLVKSCEAPNVFERPKQTANSVECRLEMGWRSFSSIARKNPCDVLSRLAGFCKIIRTFRCGWEFIVVRSIGSPMLTTKQTLQDRE